MSTIEKRALEGGVHKYPHSMDPSRQSPSAPGFQAARPGILAPHAQRGGASFNHNVPRGHRRSLIRFLELTKARFTYTSF